jgi:hypothetical protein
MVLCKEEGENKIKLFKIFTTIIFLFSLLFCSVANASDINYKQKGLGAIPSDTYNTYNTFSTHNLTQVQNIPESYIWPNLLPQVLDQGSYPMCVAYSLRAVKDMLELKYHPSTTRFHSASFIYANRNSNDYYNDGMIPRQALYNLKNSGVCLNSQFSVNGDLRTLYPLITQSMKDEALNHKITSYTKLYNSNEIQSAIMTTSPVSIMIPVFDSFYYGGILPLPNAGIESSYGYHMLTIVGWEKINGIPYYIVLNSWGSDWGIYKGYCRMPFDYPIVEAWSVVDSESYGQFLVEPNFIFSITRDSNIKYSDYKIGLLSPDGNWNYNTWYSKDIFELKIPTYGVSRIEIYIRKSKYEKWQLQKVIDIDIKN